MRIFILKHAKVEGPEYILDLIKRKKYKYKIINIFKNEKLPSMNSFDGLVLMGGPMGIYEEDKYPWLIKEKLFIKNAIKKEKKILGICLGAQLLAECLGGKVTKNKYKEIGWYPVWLTEEAKKHFIFKYLPDKFITLHWHGDTFSIPEGAQRLAWSKACNNQAFISGSNLLGLQFHPEIKIKGLVTFIKNFGRNLKKEKFVSTKKKLIPHKEIVMQNHRILAEIFYKFFN